MSRPKRFWPALWGAALILSGASAIAQPAQQPSGTAQPAKPAARAKAPAVPMVMEPRAVDLLKAMSDRLAAAKSMSFVATVAEEAPSRLGPPLVYGSRYEVTMQRPDRLRVIRTGDGPVSEFYYDAKTMKAWAPAEGLVAIADAPPTIEATLKKLFETSATYYPFTDILMPDPGAVLIGGGKLAFSIGKSTIVGGVPTEMVAWADNNVFMQIWIGADDKLPRRLRAVYRKDPLGLRHDMDLSDWRLDAPVAADAFTSAKARAGKPVAFTHPAAPVAMPAKPATPKPPAKAQ